MKHRTFWIGFWRLADPKISLASFSSMFLAAGMAGAQDVVHWGWLAATVIAVFALEVAKNASGDVFDFDSGVDQAVSEEDRSPFSGGKRVIIDELLSRRDTIMIAVIFYAVAVMIGICIAVFRDWRVIYPGGVGVACAYFYHAPPIKFSYRGLGEIVVALCYGPTLCAGAYFVQTGRLSGELIWVSSALGLLIAAFLWVNEFPDYRADLQAGKRTLVVLTGRKLASRLFGLIVFAALVMVALAPWFFPVSRYVWLGLVAAPPAVFASHRLAAYPQDTSKVIAAQSATLLSFVLLAIGTGVGALV